MGLSRWLAERAVRRAHVLVVEVPGWWRTRVEAERAIEARGWRSAASPADADVLLVCGDPDERLAAAVKRVWAQLPGPRARVRADHLGTVEAALDEAAGVLRDLDHQRTDARERPTEPACPDDDQPDHGDMDSGDMDHGDMEMVPGGIPLAEGGPDRDGLEMDVLRVPLGPVLPEWPAGLVLHCSLQGDVVVSTEVETYGAAGAAPEQAWIPATRAALLCDSAARLLVLAGDDASTAAARRARDALLDGAGTERCLPQLDRLLARVLRSRSLRWSLRDLGVIDERTQVENHLPEHVRGDVHDRLVGMLRQARAVSAEHGTRPAAEPVDQEAAVAALPVLVTGLDLAAARLVVASMVPSSASRHREQTGA